VHPIRTIEDLIHTVTNSLSLISSHAQYLQGKREGDAAALEDLQVICDEAERAAGLLGLVPQSVARIPIAATDARPAPVAGCASRRQP
jgi:nitrogen-specific signal transduction histidine kinase